ncbi:hypothetical protein TcasGA2_TC007445 [Tribolium castaneum]|uniref:Uncharacterized protein n=1 Tax=Tribolium castaneum TaxID=7070 RepID=D1ZZJ3_TRICA|nr:hypothetical protein TcasGA2_TC007445 [Tribolium castaneum]
MARCRSEREGGQGEAWACAVGAPSPLLAECPRCRSTEQVRVESPISSEVCPGFAVLRASEGVECGECRAHNMAAA